MQQYVLAIIITATAISLECNALPSLQAVLTRFYRQVFQISPPR